MSKLFMVPFSIHNGMMLEYTGCLPDSIQDENWNHGRWEWKENFVFHDDMKFTGFSRGCSSAKAVFESRLDGKQYAMFLTDLADAISGERFFKDRLIGYFTFCKRGQNYGVKIVDKEEANDQNQ